MNPLDKLRVKYTPVMGLEVHVELNTKSKMFCGCANNWFGEKPNTHTCPVCLGLPGALPVSNRIAIESCIKIGMALNCHIPLLSKFDRKNYFYPDLAKGYQISQYDQPFAEHGYIVLSSGKKIGITRAHMEEDTGKLLHETVDSKHVSLIDFNRSGVPLVEIVTDPDFVNAAEVKEYLQKLQQIVRYLGVARADMDKGEMRLEPNISLRLARHPQRSEGSKDSSPMARDDKPFELPNYKVEVKNINSFNFVEKAITYEIDRQSEILDRGEVPAQETRGWDEDKKKTISQRSKEEAADYRYFPEPDIPPFLWTQDFIETLKKDIPELPDAKVTRFVKDYHLSVYNAEILTRSKEMADYFEEAVKICLPELVSGSKKENKEMPKQVRHDINPTKLANTIINKKVDIEKVLPAALVKDIVTSSVVATIDVGELNKIIQSVLSENEKAVLEYKAGKEMVVMFLFGSVMKRLSVKIDPQLLKSALIAQLKEM